MNKLFLFLFVSFFMLTSFNFLSIKVIDDFLSLDKDNKLIMHMNLKSDDNMAKFQNSLQDKIYEYDKDYQSMTLKNNCPVYNVYKIIDLKLKALICNQKDYVSVQIFDFEKKAIVDPKMLFNIKNSFVPDFYLKRIEDKKDNENKNDFINIKKTYTVKKGKYNFFIDFKNFIKPKSISINIKNNNKKVILDFSSIKTKNEKYYIKSNLKLDLESLLKDYPMINIGQIEIFENKNDFDIKVVYNFEKRLDLYLFGK